MADPVTHSLTTDELWPRDDEHRYRIYARVGRELRVLCACPEPGGIGTALVTLHQDMKESGGRLADLGRIGVLDVRVPAEIGFKSEWIVLPFDRFDAQQREMQP